MHFREKILVLFLTFFTFLPLLLGQTPQKKAITTTKSAPLPVDTSSLSLKLSQPKPIDQNAQPTVIQLPDEDSIYFNLLSAIGGVGGGGILLVFFLRRAVRSYDEAIAKAEARQKELGDKFEKNQKEMVDKFEGKWDSITKKLEDEYKDLSQKVEDKTDKIHTLLQDLSKLVQDLKFEVFRVKEMSVDKMECLSRHADNSIKSNKVESRFAALESRVDAIEKKQPTRQRAWDENSV